MMSIPESLHNTLTSYLEGQKHSGVRNIHWKGDLPGQRKLLPPEPATPPKPTSAPPLEKAASSSSLPPSAPQQPVVKPSQPGTSWMKAVRHPECLDEDWPSDGWILIVSEDPEFTNQAGKLMTDMLHAIGFVSDSHLSTTEHPIPQNATRVLVFGDHSLQQVSTAGMKLQLVRGLWQETPYGRMLATYAPSSVMDSPAGKKTVWGDLQNLASDLGVTIPKWTKQKLKKK